jgi:predicted DNA-binding transcriptional regulator AlpA
MSIERAAPPPQQQGEMLMPKPKRTPRQEQPEALTPPPPKLAMSISEFCEAHGFSVALFHKLRKKGQTPRLMKLGARTLISLEAAAAWRERQENASKY